jgi:hypothetical protein
MIYRERDVYGRKRSNSREETREVIEMFDIHEKKDGDLCNSTTCEKCGAVVEWHVANLFMRLVLWKHIHGNENCWWSWHRHGGFDFFTPHMAD